MINKTSSGKLSDLYEKMIKNQSEENAYLKAQNETLLKTIEGIVGKK